MIRTYINKISFIYSKKVDLLKSCLYTIKWSKMGCGKFIVAKKTNIVADKNAIKIKGNVYLGIPKGIFGYISIPGKEHTLINIDKGGQLRLNNNVYLYSGTRIILSSNANIEIGENTSISANTYVLAQDSITIGRDCAISWDCQIMDTDFHNIGNECKSNCAPVNIGNHVLICSKVTILKGVTIGDNVVIAANSVVTRDVPDNCIVAGSPAKVIDTNVEWK